MTYAVSTAGLALVQEFEGFQSEPTPLADGSWIVGYGHVRAGSPGLSVSQTEAADLLVMDVAPVERVVNVLVTQPLAQSQFDALVSFAFSIGLDAFASSQVLRRVNAGDYVAAACAMDAWRKAEVDGEMEVSPALVRRRAAEKALFMQGVPVTATPSVVRRARLDHAASILGAPVNSNTRSASVVQMVTTSTLAPDVGAVAIQDSIEAPVFVPAVRLTEILKSEPATEALLLTQVANDVDFDDDGEIVTAHAKPVARTLEEVRAATRRAYQEQNAQAPKSLFSLFKPRDEAPVSPIKPDRRLRDMRRRAQAERLMSYLSFEQVGLAALLVFGLGLIALGGSLLVGGEGGMIELAAAAGVAVPGMLAVAMAAYGFWRTPHAA